ncbi:MAG: SDR family NAD(P)-dependent oxidoreductase [Polyangiaceae bacterium]|nr:SDR family NAD(P)-dependent oxidoreductase [Polyangiaceae bacterium]
MEPILAGKHVVITGGTGALGGAVVHALRVRGAICHVPVAEPGEVESFSLRDDEGVKLAVGVNLRSEEAAKSFFQGVPPLFASVHLAGGFSMAPVAETRLADLEYLLGANVHTCFLACREAVARMRAAGEGGRIVNVSARPALVPTGGMAAYSAAKAAVAALTLSLAEELAPEGIWVNAVVPSTIDTPANRASMPGADFERWPKVEDVAEAIASLVSVENRCVRGALVPVYGRS